MLLFTFGLDAIGNTDRSNPKLDSMPTDRMLARDKAVSASASKTALCFTSGTDFFILYFSPLVLILGSLLPFQ